MRTLVDIPERQLAELKKIGEVKKRSRAALIREAVDKYVDANRSPSRKDAIKKAFGLWGDREIDGVEYQRKLRDEW